MSINRLKNVLKLKLHLAGLITETKIKVKYWTRAYPWHYHTQTILGQLTAKKSL